MLTQALLPALRAAHGTVVFVNSGAGLSANAHWAGYAASKFGLRALADALRAEEAEHGVRVSTVYPGRTATPMQQKVHEQEGRAYDAGHVDPAGDRRRDDPARCSTCPGTRRSATSRSGPSERSARPLQRAQAPSGRGGSGAGSDEFRDRARSVAA